MIMENSKAQTIRFVDFQIPWSYLFSIVFKFSRTSDMNKHRTHFFVFAQPFCTEFLIECNPDVLVYNNEIPIVLNPIFFLDN